MNDDPIPPVLETANFLLERLDAPPRFRAGMGALAGFEVGGWALDTQDPARPVTVEIWVAGELLGTAETGLERGDIARFVPGSWAGFLLDLRRCAPERLLATLRALLPLRDDMRPLALRIEGLAQLPPHPSSGITADALRRALMTLPPGLLLAAQEEAPSPSHGALLATLAGEAALFDEDAHLAAHPEARRTDRSELAAAFEDALARALPPAEPDGTYPYGDAVLLMRGEVALAEGRAGEARQALMLGVARLLGEALATHAATALDAACAALEAGQLSADPWRERLLARAAFFLALALEDGPRTAEAWLGRLAPLLDRLHTAESGGRSRLSDLRWWVRLAPFLLGNRAPGAGALRTLCLEAWQQAPPGQREGKPMPPTPRMRRLLLLAWSAEAAAAGQWNEALAAALQASRELLSLREGPWRRAIRPVLLALFEAASPDARDLAAVLAAIFEANAAPRRAPAGLAFLRLCGLAAMPSRRIAPRREAARPAVDVAFLVGAPEGESLRYRVLNLVEALEERGLRAETFLPHEGDRLAAHCGSLATMVAFRAPLGERLESGLRAARRLGARVVFDVDDLTFDPALAHEMRSLAEMDRQEREGAMVGLRLYREALLAADAVTGSTAAIAEAAEALARPARIVPNTHGAFERHIARRTPRHDEAGIVRLGYFSGTWTHRGDFAQMERAVLEAMRRHPQTRLLVAGALRLGPEWDEFAGRITRAPLLPHPLMLELYAQVDVNFAPLEHGARFCEAKSELKVFEAGLFGVPSAASPTAPYAAAITDGVDGFLAASEADWTRALDRLIAEPELRRQIGAAARERALRQFADARAGEAWEAAKADLLATAPRPLSLCLLPPSGKAEAAEALRLGEALSLLGHRVALDIPLGGEADSTLPVAANPAGLAPDLLLATDGPSLPRLRPLEAQTGGRAARLIQVDEAAREPLGARRLAAEAALSLPLPRIARGAVLAERLGAARFDPAPDRTLFHPRPETGRAARLVAFRTDSDDPLRCHELGIAALEQLRAMVPGVEIVVAGIPAPKPRKPEDPPPRRPVRALPAGLSEEKAWPDRMARALLYSAATVGLCFAPDGMDEAGFEMVACGLPVVDALSPLAPREDALCRRVEPAPEHIARALAGLLDDAAAREAQAARATAALDALPGPIGQARQVEAWLRGLVSSPS
ncbi:glycosyltransferase family protein [Sabulicella glaciei]|uniref:Glycosyltransferase n=1 Tax=Sabulicella glaciei TaxID=2984948 RepID=A0ABT3NPL6_9PROT|nr:glycosyltransferase [Roseococcus sp. MDT2-1-1]MCW8084110.1 glycosyltransferase [Roseococcus sp. MDT2-1-1]